MKILWLGPYREKINHFLLLFNDEVIHHDGKMSANEIIQANADYVISYGYRYIISKEAVPYYKNKMINLHISLLPWNKGADPNLWSFLENTPKGVTIHYIDEGIDTGDIIAQKEVIFSEEETLATSYQKLTIEIENLFYKLWPIIRSGNNDRHAQKELGSYHKSSDKERYKYLLTNGWNTKVRDLIYLK